MKNPFLGKALLIYFGIWAAIMAANTAFLYFIYDHSLPVSIVDGILSHLLTSGLGLTFLYLVQYLSPKSNKNNISTIMNMGLAVVIAVSLASFVSYKLLVSIFRENLAYIEFVGDTLPWRIFVGTLLLAIVVMIYYLIRYNNDLHQRNQDSLQLQNMLKESELEMLKFQINPHFIFNSLNSISGLTITAPDQAREMVVKLSDFLRSSLGSDNKDLHTLDNEISQMTLYLDIEKVRFGDRLQIKYDVDKNCHKQKLPNMILQPLYENAVKYGVYEQLDNVIIETVTKCEDGVLRVSVSNNYDCEQTAQQGSGIGLKNVQNRLELIYGKSDLVTIEKNQHKFTVHLLIPQQ